MKRILTLLLLLFILSLYNCNSVDRSVSTSSSEVEFKNYSWVFEDTVLLDNSPAIDFRFNHIYSLRVTPDACISYYAAGNYLVKDCGGKIERRKVLENEQAYYLANYYWIDSSKIAFFFQPSYLGEYMDKCIFTYNFEKGEKETIYNFEGLNFKYTSLNKNNASLKNRLTYDYSLSYDFIPVYDYKDSSLIIPVKPSINKLNLNNEMTETDILNTEVLAKVYPISSGKNAHKLNISYGDFLDPLKEKVLHNFLFYGVSSHHNKEKNTLLLSTNISNKTIEYHLLTGEKRVLTDNNYMMPPTVGFDTVPKFNNNSRTKFKQIFYNSSNNTYYRQVFFPTTYENGSTINFMVNGLIIMDTLFNEVGFAMLPKDYAMIGFDKDNNFVMHCIHKQNFETRQTFFIGKLDTFEIQKGYAKIPEEFIKKAIASNYNKYFNSISKEILENETVVILPFDNTCPTCVNRMKTFLSLSDTIVPNTKLIVIFGNKNSFNEFYSTFLNEEIKKHIYFDYNNKYLDVINLPDKFIQLRKSKKGVFEIEKEYNPSTIENLIDLLSVTPMNIGPTCIEKK